MSEYTRQVVEEELRNKLDELQIELAKARNGLEVERELRQETERDLQAVKHDRDLQEKQIKELQEELEKEKRVKTKAVIAGAKMSAKCDAAEAARDAYIHAFDVAIGIAFGEDDDDDD